jgi:hypothetical protein
MRNRAPVPRSERPALPAFEPVPRRYRHDGWTPERQKAFIEALADTGCVTRAAAMVNMSQANCYALRRAPGAEGFRRAWDAALDFGLKRLKDIAFERAIEGQLVPVFVAGKLMGFRRKKNDRLLMFILRHYGQDAGGRKTTVNYFSTRATAGAARADPAADPSAVALAKAEASTTTVKTVISGGNSAPTQLATEDDAANVLNAFQGVALDAEAQAEIYRALEACAERRRALEDDPENDPQCDFVRVAANDIRYLGDLESGVEDDWVEYRPEGEHRWEGLGEGGEAERIDAVLEEMKRAREQGAGHPATAQRGNTAALPAPEVAPSPDPLGEPSLEPEPSPDDPRLDWRNWTDEGYTLPEPPSPRLGVERGQGSSGRGAGAQRIEGEAEAGGKPPRIRKKPEPKPPFTPPDDARKAQALAEVEAARRAGAAAAAARRRRQRGGAATEVEDFE